MVMYYLYFMSPSLLLGIYDYKNGVRRRYFVLLLSIKHCLLIYISSKIFGLFAGRIVLYAYAEEAEYRGF